MREISWLTANQLASQEGLCTMEYGVLKWGLYFWALLIVVRRGQCLQFLRVMHAVGVYLKAGHVAFATWLTTASWPVVQFEFKGTNPAVVRYSFDSKGGRPTVGYWEWKGEGCGVSCVLVALTPHTLHQAYVPAPKLSVYILKYLMFIVNYYLRRTTEVLPLTFRFTRKGFVL